MKKIFLKYIIYSFSLLVFSTVLTLPTFAQVAAVKNPDGTPAITGTKKAIVDEKKTTDSDKVDNLKARALQEIDRRIQAFTLVQKKISTLNHLSEKNKSALLAQITSEMTALTTIKTTVTNETDLSALKQKVQTIITSYKVFAIMVPKIHIMIASEMIDETADKIASVSALSKEENAEASSSATDDSQKDVLDNVALAHSNAASARSMALSVSTLTLSTGKVTLQKARTHLVVARQDLAEARQDLARDDEPDSTK